MAEDFKLNTVTGLVHELARVQDEQEHAHVPGLHTSTRRQPVYGERRLRGQLWCDIMRTAFATMAATSTECRDRIVHKLAKRYGRSEPTIRKDISTFAPST